jgi:hypothetical protein
MELLENWYQRKKVSSGTPHRDSGGVTFLLEFKVRLNSLRRSLLFQYFNSPLGIFYTSSKFLLIPSHTLGSDDVKGSNL